jgi:hypothetical protein
MISTLEFYQSVAQTVTLGKHRAGGVVRAGRQGDRNRIGRTDGAQPPHQSLEMATPASRFTPNVADGLELRLPAGLTTVPRERSGRVDQSAAG